MSIDWFTFAAQIVNFLILIWLLKRLLYGPIVRAMFDREEQVAKRFTDAEAIRVQAEASERHYENKLQELAQAKETMTAEAGQDVDAWRSEQLQRAKVDVEDDRRQWHEELTREKQALLRELQLDVTQHAVELGRHVLYELADQDLQTRLIERFMSRLSETDLGTLKSPGGTAAENALVVESSHELSVADQTRIKMVLSETDAAVTFQLNPQLICGIELQSPGCRFAWNLREATAEVESDLIDAIEETLPGISTEQARDDSIVPGENALL